MNRMLLALASAGMAAIAGTAFAGTMGPVAYSRLNDSPLMATANSLYIETFEDGLANTYGVSYSAGYVLNPSIWTDSVDGDDGLVDGLGRGGRSYYVPNAISGVEISFSPIFESSNGLPTCAGFVWTDGLNPVLVQAFNAQGQIIGTLNGEHADDNYQGTTEDDRFYGFEWGEGISKIRITSATPGGVEFDHVQFGMIPTPASLALVGIGGLLVARRRR